MIRCFWGLEHFGDSGENADGFALATFLGVGVFVVFGLIFRAVTHDLVSGFNGIYEESKKAELVRFVYRMRHFRA
jgi:hypothetical protein